MSPIIAAKYGGPCIKCGKQIKAGRFVNWERGRGISHLDETDNKKLSFSMLDPSHVEDGCHPKAGGLPTDVHQGEEKIMGSNGDNDTINVNDLIKALQGMTGKVAKSPKKEKKQRQSANQYTKALTDKQISFCELMALGSSRADAYTDSYNVTNPAFSKNAARKLLSHEKIRNKIAEFRSDLEGKDTGYVVEPKGTGKGWVLKLTEKQENFCQARASGDTIVDAFKKSGYSIVNWTEKRIRKHANRLMGLSKIKNRIADITSGCAPTIEKGRLSKIRQKISTGPASFPFTADGIRVGKVSMPDLAELNEFVDNFVELIKAHGRLFHHAVVTRGQEEVGIPGADVKGVEDAVYRSIETLRETLSEKLS